MSHTDDDGALEPNREDDFEGWFEQQVQDKAVSYKIAKQARLLVNNETAINHLDQLPTQPSFLSDGPPDTSDDRPRIAGLLGSGHNALVMATRKAGKTVLGINLVRSLVDGVPFLDQFDVRPLDGTAVYLNYELADWQAYQWFNDLGIKNTDQVSPLTLRGMRLPIMTDDGAAWFISYLKNAGAEFLVVDTAAKAFKSAGGIDENSNAEVLDFLLRLDEIKAEAGVSEVVLPIHANRESPHRVRGASMWEDHVDGIWRLSRANGKPAEFRTVDGRDLDSVTGTLHYDPETRRLSWITDTQPLEREVTKPEDPHLQEIIDYVRQYPGQAKETVFGVIPVGRTKFNSLVDQAVELYKIEIRRDGNRRLLFPVESFSHVSESSTSTQPHSTTTQPVDRTQPLNHSTTRNTRTRCELSGVSELSDELSNNQDDDYERARPRVLDFSEPDRLITVGEFFEQARDAKKGTRTPANVQKKKAPRQRSLKQGDDELTHESYNDITAANKEGVDQ